MAYEVRFSDKALKSLKKTVRMQVRIILSWIEKNLSGCPDPRILGKPLVGDKSEYWRYRIGLVRVITEIDDGMVTVIMINVAQQREVYER